MSFDFFFLIRRMRIAHIIIMERSLPSDAAHTLFLKLMTLGEILNVNFLMEKQKRLVKIRRKYNANI